MSEDYIPAEQEEEDLASDEEDTTSIPGPVSSTGVAIPSASTTASTYQTAASFSHDFALDFPDRYVLLHTPAHALQCALFALTLSIPAQHDTLRPPQIEELRSLANTSEVQDRIKQANAQTALEEAFNANYSVDQVAAVLQEYGSREGRVLLLGLHLPNSSSVLFAIDAPEDIVVI
jgi:hypothetical protein